MFPVPGGEFGKTALAPPYPNRNSCPDGMSANSNQPVGLGSFSFGVQLVQDEKTGAPGLAPVFAGQVLPVISLEQAVKDSNEPANEIPRAVPLAPSKITLGPRIDKSVLAIGTERRVRDKIYLKQFRELPCTICGRLPSHAHHLRFAQGRGLSQKVSDEYVVPLCGLHHGDLHRGSDEPGWWTARKIDPIPIAAELWRRYRGEGK